MLSWAAPEYKHSCQDAQWHRLSVPEQGVVCVSGRGQGMLSRFLEVLVRKLLLDSGAGALTGLAADALLPLILAHPQAYQDIGVAH